MKKNKVMPNNGLIMVTELGAKENDKNRDIIFKPSFFHQPPPNFNSTPQPTPHKEANKNMEEEKKKEESDEEHGIIYTLTTFSENTTAHGFGHIISAKSNVKRLLWASIMIAFYVVLIIVIQPLIEKYLGRPLLSKQTIIYESKPTFPTVVLCNQNIAEKDRYEELLQELNKTYDTIHPFRALQNKKNVYYYGHKFNTTVLKCDFKNVKNSCFSVSQNTRESWYEFWNPKFGTCWAFNTDSEDPLHVTRTGPEGGLHFHLNTLQEKYIENTLSAGFRLFIGSQGSEFDLEDKVILLAPGFKYDISVSKHFIERADPFKNGSCIKDKRETMVEHIERSEYHIDKITHKFCNKMCASKKIIEECGCADLTLPLPVKYKDVENCLEDDEPCSRKIIHKWFDDELDCHCPPACNNVLYSMSTYFQDYPSQIVRQREVQNGNPDPKKNLLSVSIYFMEKVFPKSQEEVYYTFITLIADMGGQLGLFGGFSFLTVIEFCVLFVVIFFKLGLKCFKSKK